MRRIVNAIPKRAIGWHAFHLGHKVYAASLGFVVDFAPPARAPVGFVCVRRTSGFLTLTIEVSTKCKHSDRMWLIRSSMHAFKCLIKPAMFKESLLPKRGEGLRHTGIYTRTHALCSTLQCQTRGTRDRDGRSNCREMPVPGCLVHAHTSIMKPTLRYPNLVTCLIRLPTAGLLACSHSRVNRRSFQELVGWDIHTDSRGL